MSAPLLNIEDLRVHFPVRGGWLGGELVYTWGVNVGE